MKRFFNENEELVKMVGMGVLVLVGVVAIIGIFYFGTRAVGGESYIDKISGEEVSTAETGGGFGIEGPAILGAKEIGAWKGDKFVEGVDLIEKYFGGVMPEVKTVSVRKDSGKEVGGVTEFELVARGETFKVEIRDDGQELKLFYGGERVFDARIGEFKVKRHKAVLNEMYLPHTLETKEGRVLMGKAVWTENYYAEYDGCEKDEKKEKQIKLELENWLKLKGFEPKEFNFKIENRCDGGCGDDHHQH